ncbi:MAG: hypothetical protein JXA73_24385 [Acidobacteria bacterium]|nr:hypothetical protein [Acidobacteriota bacterium]
MRIPRKWFSFASLLLLLIVATGMEYPEGRSSLPPFGRDTVLVWKIQNLEYEASFVVRIAQFLPDRFFEWEDEQTQGTIFISNELILSAKGFVNSSLFQSGADSTGRDATTLWLSRQIYRDLKERKKVKCILDGVAGTFKYSGEDTLTVEVNRSTVHLAVIKVLDDRGSERWFLDQEDNPLMLNHRLRNFSQTLTSITTDRSKTLRWIKGKKLANPPRG